MDRAGTKRTRAEGSRSRGVSLPAPIDAPVAHYTELRRRLAAFGIDCPPGRSVDSELHELDIVLGTDYAGLATLPSTDATRCLSGVIDAGVKPFGPIWRRREDPAVFGPLARMLGSWGIEVREAPYHRLSLWGFSYHPADPDRLPSLIFLNSAHHPGAMASTLGHELGHCIGSSMLGNAANRVQAMKQGALKHLGNEQEVFADAAVALLAFTSDVLQPWYGRRDAFWRSLELVGYAALSSISSPFRIDVFSERIATRWRICYLTSTIHYLKLRMALNEIGLSERSVPLNRC